jgi:hypothetical protein
MPLVKTSTKPAPKGNTSPFQPGKPLPLNTNPTPRPVERRMSRGCSSCGR